MVEAQNGEAARASQPQKERSARGRPAAGEIERRKAVVIEVATQLFIQQGFVQTTMFDIARSAGVSSRTVDTHFGSKEELFREVIYARKESARMPSRRPVEGAALKETLEREAREIVDYVLANRSTELVRLMVSESRRFPELIQELISSIFRRVVDNITETFVHLERLGQIPMSDHAASGRLFADLIVGTLPLQAYAYGEPDPPSPELLALKTAMFIRGRFGSEYA